VLFRLFPSSDRVSFRSPSGPQIGDDFLGAAEFLADRDVDVEHPLEALGPDHGRSRSAGVRGTSPIRWPYTLAPLRGGDQGAVPAVGGELAVEASEVHPRPGHQGHQPGDEV